MQPKVHHDAVVLFNGLVLEPAGVEERGDELIVTICGMCLKEMAKFNPDPPRYSLANNLWIGWIPWELLRMTMPKQMLVALLYPQVFVYKLYNKTSHTQDRSTLQRVMRGNVITYALNNDSIASMLEGNLMPRPVEILSSIIMVTFIGQEKLRLDQVRSLFRVWCQVVLAALLWLKTYNLRYYGGIQINSD